MPICYIEYIKHMELGICENLPITLLKERNFKGITTWRWSNMDIKSVQNIAGHQNSVNSTESAKVQSKQLSHIDVSTTSVAQEVKAVFKQGNQEQNVNEDLGRHTQATESQIRAAISEANYKAIRTRCEFSVDEATKRISIKVIDKESNNIIREIPAEESLEMLAKIWELAGILVDEKR